MEVSASRRGGVRTPIIACRCLRSEERRHCRIAMAGEKSDPTSMTFPRIPAGSMSGRGQQRKHAARAEFGSLCLDSFRAGSVQAMVGVGHERSSRAHRQGPVRCHPALIPAALMIGHQFSISVFWNAASASAKNNTEARSFSCLLRPTICRCHADLADWLDDQPVPGEGQPSFERHVTGERQSVADRVAE